MNQKFEKLIERVYEKTKQGQLSWQVAAADDAFEVDLGNGTLLLFQGRTPGEGFPYTGITLFDASGRILENDTVPENPDFGTSRAEDLFRLARSSARKSEHAIDELLKGLG
jgi:hypothetical protein